MFSRMKAASLVTVTSLGVAEVVLGRARQRVGYERALSSARRGL